MEDLQLQGAAHVAVGVWCCIEDPLRYGTVDARLFTLGAGMPGPLDGMFAFAFYDPRAILLVGARRLGVKPLYCHFGGEAALLDDEGSVCLQWIDRKIDRASLLHYLRTIRTSRGSTVDGVNL